MARFMTLIISLLLSLSAGFGTYALGAIVWCIIDPDDVGAKMLFTIPVALAGMIVPGILGLVGCAFRCEFITEPRVAPTGATPVAAPLRPSRQSRPASEMDEEIDFALAT